MTEKCDRHFVFGPGNDRPLEIEKHLAEGEKLADRMPLWPSLISDIILETETKEKTPMTDIPEPSAEDMALDLREEYPDPDENNAWPIIRRAYHAERKLAALEKRIAESTQGTARKWQISNGGATELVLHITAIWRLNLGDRVRLVPVEEP